MYNMKRSPLHNGCNYFALKVVNNNAKRAMLLKGMTFKSLDEI